MALNKEAERKAFEEAFIANRAKYAEDNKLNVESVVANVKLSLAKGYIPAAIFEMWLAAKEHAIEEAKPKATVFQDGRWWWIRCNGVIIGCYTTSDFAVKEAEKANMKVVSVTGFDHGEAQ